MFKTWMCTYSNQAGSNARAMFDSRESATQFAERHARTATTAAGMRLEWNAEPTNESVALSTELGVYVVAPALTEQPLGSHPGVGPSRIPSNFTADVVSSKRVGDAPVLHRWLHRLDVLRASVERAITSAY
jgi:hypothetical protein